MDVCGIRFVVMSSPPVVCWLGRDLSNATLYGSIPEALWHLTQLEVLFLYNNQLSSTISPSIGNLQKLTDL